MTITITEKEFEALNEVIDQVCTDYEAASNEEYLESMGKSIDLVRNVLMKYKSARQKAREYQQVRAYVAEKNRNRNLRARDIDKLARKVLRKMNEL